MEKMVNADLASMGITAQKTVQQFSYGSFSKAVGNVNYSSLKSSPTP
jgi:hypothetical protein